MKYYSKLVIPKINCIYYEGNDYTNYIYFKNLSDIQEFLQIAKNNGLHVLELSDE